MRMKIQQLITMDLPGENFEWFKGINKYFKNVFRNLGFTDKKETEVEFYFFELYVEFIVSIIP